MIGRFEINGYVFTPTGTRMAFRKTDCYVGPGGKKSYGLLNEWKVTGPGLNNGEFMVYSKSRVSRADLVDYVRKVCKVDI